MHRTKLSAGRWLRPAGTWLVAVLLVFVVGLNAWGVPQGGRWYEEDGSPCPIGADWLIPVDQMRFDVPDGERCAIQRPDAGFIPDEGGACYFVSVDAATGNAQPPAAHPPLATDAALPVCAFRVPPPLFTDDVPAYYPHGPPSLPARAAPRTAAPRAPPVCS